MKSNLVLKEASAIAERMYEIANDIQLHNPDEEWRTVSKIKNATNDAYFYTARVTGSGEAQSLEFDCINARKDFNSAKAMYIFASKQGMIDLDFELVVRIDKLVAAIDNEHSLSQRRIKEMISEEMKPWQEKYRIWQEISKK